MSYLSTSTTPTLLSPNSRRAAIVASGNGVVATSAHLPTAPSYYHNGWGESQSSRPMRQYAAIAAAIFLLHGGLWLATKYWATPTVQPSKPKPVIIELVKPPIEKPPVPIPAKPLPQDTVTPKAPPIVAKAEAVRKQPEPSIAEKLEHTNPTPEPVKTVQTTPIAQTPVSTSTPSVDTVPIAPPTQTTAVAVPSVSDGPITEAKGYAGYLNNPAPEYPEQALERGWEGQVILRIKVQPSGKPSEINVKKSSGRKVLDDTAIRTVKRWIFSPAKQGNTAIEGWVDVPLEFKLPSA